MNTESISRADKFMCVCLAIFWIFSTYSKHNANNSISIYIQNPLPNMTFYAIEKNVELLLSFFASFEFQGRKLALIVASCGSLLIYFLMPLLRPKGGGTYNTYVQVV